MGSAESGQTNAILYSIVESVRRRGFDPWAYLKWVLEKLPESKNTDLPSLTPKAYARLLKDKRHRSQHAA